MAADRILIAGAGALGSVFGGMLAAKGHRVAMLGRRAHLDAIARDGLKLSGLFGERVVRGIELADDSARLSGRFGLILCTAKAYDTATVADAVADRLDDDGVIVSIQNGLGNIEALAERFSLRRVLGAMVIFGAEIRTPGASHVTVIAEPVAIGPAPALHGALSTPLAERAREVAAIIAGAGIPAVSRADITPAIWGKLLYNVALNPLGALLGLHYGALVDDPGLRAIINDAIDEAFSVARGVGVALPFADAAAYRDVFYGKLIPPTYEHRPSMIADLKRRGRTEIDALNGKVVELADRLGLRAETNRMLVRLIKAAERKARAALAEAS
ncbi:MAG TPA: ketopantoate reductase family protein [Candidatus Binataceae bacterium]|nr:ketopantoate reductase family protein [Candidatus Binataceae bacterium]